MTPGRPPLRDAAAVVLTREGPGGLEVFWVQRTAGLGRRPAFAGFHAFPGGSVDATDAAAPDPLARAAVRELFEETGVLLGSAAPPGELSRLRKATLEGTLPHADAESLFEPGTSALTPAGRWITPDFARVRFDARFFLAALPARQSAEVWPGELQSGEWVTPRRALERWAQGEALLHPPALHVLRCLDEDSPDLAPRLCHPPFAPGFVAQRIEYQRGVWALPLRTPTLPPATHTCCYLLGDRDLVVVDPGASEPTEQARLHALVEGLLAEGRRLLAVVLTHHHVDHVLGARAVCEAFSAPLWAHARTAAHVGPVARELEDGEELVLRGPETRRWQVLHTPGHASGHLALLDPESRACVCGDLLSGASTVILDPPDGDLDAYLASLRRLQDLGVRTLYPAHGEPLTDAPERLGEALAHRAFREARIVGALGPSPQPLGRIACASYPDVPAAALPLAERTTLATLLSLERREMARRDGEEWARAD